MLSGGKGEILRCALIGGCWHREAVGGLTRSRASYVVSQGCIFVFLWLVLSWKLGQNREAVSS